MADADDVRRVALALPHVVEIDSDGFDFRVGGKGFVWSYPEREPGKRRVIRTDIAVLFVGDEAEKQALLLGEPARFLSTPRAGIPVARSGNRTAGTSTLPSWTGSWMTGLSSSAARSVTANRPCIS